MARVNVQKPLARDNVLTNVKGERPKFAEDWVGRTAVWTVKTRVQVVTVLVRVVEAHRKFNRIDCLVETNTGSRAWVSDKTLKLVPKDVAAG